MYLNRNSFNVFSMYCRKIPWNKMIHLLKSTIRIFGIFSYRDQFWFEIHIIFILNPNEIEFECESDCPLTDLNNSLLFDTPPDQVTTVPNDTRLSANKWCWHCESKSTLLLAALVFATIQCVKTMAHRWNRILPLMSRSHQVCHAIPCADPGIRIPFFKDIATSFFSNNYYPMTTMRLKMTTTLTSSELFIELVIIRHFIY